MSESSRLRPTPATSFSTRSQGPGQPARSRTRWGGGGSWWSWASIATPTSSRGWQGGGGFRYFRLAPSLLKEDRWGRLVINPAFNPELLAEAVCKLEGFRYEPSAEVYWQQGRSTERDFLYVTTAAMNDAQLQQLSEEVGPERSLLVLCSSFRQRSGGYPNLTVKKIPAAVLERCEWGRDDYSLRVAALPEAEREARQAALFPEGAG